MKIIIEKSQAPIVTIDTENCHHPYAIVDAIELALKIEGHDRWFIDEVFHRITEEPEINEDALTNDRDTPKRDEIN